MMPLDHTLVSLAVITILPERMGLRYVKNESPAESERADSPPRDHGHHRRTPQRRTNTYGNIISLIKRIMGQHCRHGLRPHRRRLPIVQR